MKIILPNKIPKLKHGLGAASRLEKEYSITAEHEKDSEFKRALTLPKDSALRSELIMDSKVAEAFEDWRAKRARALKVASKKEKKG